MKRDVLLSTYLTWLLHTCAMTPHNMWCWRLTTHDACDSHVPWRLTTCDIVVRRHGTSIMLWLVVMLWLLKRRTMFVGRAEVTGLFYLWHRSLFTYDIGLIYIWYWSLLHVIQVFLIHEIGLFYRSYDASRVSTSWCVVCCCDSHHTLEVSQYIHSHHTLDVSQHIHVTHITGRITTWCCDTTESHHDVWCESQQHTTQHHVVTLVSHNSYDSSESQHKRQSHNMMLCCESHNMMLCRMMVWLTSHVILWLTWVSWVGVTCAMTPPYTICHMTLP